MPEWLAVKSDSGLLRSIREYKCADVYAVSDCVGVYDAVTGFSARTQSPLGSTAVRQVRVAAKNIVGIDASFRPVLNAMVPG